jgi:ribulose-phosphate 3-epimerase
MTKPVDSLIESFAMAGATFITFHPEASTHIDRSLQLIRDKGCKSGLAFNPATPLEYLKHVADKLDMILIMSVNPGFGGQKFISGILNKVREAREFIDKNKLPIRLEVDGGIKIDNIAKVAEAGADTFVIGSAIFNTHHYQETINDFRNALQNLKE